MKGRLVTVFGGSGFIGRHLVRRLAQREARINVAVRDVEGAKFLKPMGAVGQITPIAANLRDDASVARAVAGASMVVNLVAVLYERGPQTFDALQHKGAERVARAAAAAGVARLVHVSAIGADPSAESAYARAKGLGEAAVRTAFRGATILRPSVVFGPEDDFFNRFARLARLSPVLPLIGGGRTRFQPVYVGDVAEAIMQALTRPEAAGHTYELGGPRVYSLREIMDVTLREIRRKRLLVPLPFSLAAVQARFLEWLPVPPLTRDQVTMLRQDNVVAPGALGLPDLGISPTLADAILPTYLDRFRPGGRTRA